MVSQGVELGMGGGKTPVLHSQKGISLHQLIDPILFKQLQEKQNPTSLIRAEDSSIRLTGAHEPLWRLSQADGRWSSELWSATCSDHTISHGQSSQCLERGWSGSPIALQGLFVLAGGWLRATGIQQCMCLKTDASEDKTYTTITVYDAVSKCFFTKSLLPDHISHQEWATFPGIKNCTFRKSNMWTPGSRGSLWVMRAKRRLICWFWYP